MPRSLQWMDLYQIWFRGSPRGRNQVCGILLQSAHGFRFCEGSKFAISHWLGRSPLTQCWRYRAACDRDLEIWAKGHAKSLKNGSIRKPVYGFLFAFCSNHGRIFSRLWNIQRQRMVWPWKLGYGLFNVIENSAVRSTMYDFLLVRRCKCTVFELCDVE